MKSAIKFKGARYFRMKQILVVFSILPIMYSFVSGEGIEMKNSITRDAETPLALDVPACTFVNERVKSCQTVKKPKCRLLSRRKCQASVCSSKSVQKCQKMDIGRCRARCSRSLSRGTFELEKIKKCKLSLICSGKYGKCGEKEICYNKPSVAKSLGRCIQSECLECKSQVVLECDKKKAKCGVEEERVCRDEEESECKFEIKPVLACNEILRVPLSAFTTLQTK